MSEKVFLAGASGAIGKSLVPLLLNAGHVVYGMTRRPEQGELLKALGAIPVVVDVYDTELLTSTIAAIQPATIIHQLTDLPPGLDPSTMAAAVVNNARIRDVGTRNLVTAARAAGAQQLIAQSIAWAYQPGLEPCTETHPLDLDATGARRTTVQGVAALERQVLGEPSLNGVVLRYGHLYGPNTGALSPSSAIPVHVVAAAQAALLALQSKVPGIFNIVEDNVQVSNEKAKLRLGWSPLGLTPGISNHD